jgi:hypothetical protein
MFEKIRINFFKKEGPSKEKTDEKKEQESEKKDYTVQTSIQSLNKDVMTLSLKKSEQSIYFVLDPETNVVSLSFEMPDDRQAIIGTFGVENKSNIHNEIFVPHIHLLQNPKEENLDLESIEKAIMDFLKITPIKKREMPPHRIS